ncbi:MAG: mechanosensitive ion channel family protein [Candidatus Nanohaloarchaeota archaeon QJJ-9]|nr:mechanosensitive ion channel family protein [Candidatus Nanohaloarchaeota archaeon QJJ-9]
MVPSLPAQNFLELTSANPWRSFVLLAVISIVGAKIVEFVVVKILKVVFDRTDNPKVKAIFKNLSVPLYATLALSGLYKAVMYLPNAVSYVFYIKSVFLTAMIAVWAKYLSRMGKGAISGEDDYKFSPVIANLWTLLVVIGAVFSLLSVWNVDITPLLASAGIAGLAIGFAAQETIANFFGGLSLYFDHTYNVGDYIRLESGEEGTVEDLGVRSTTLRTRNNEIITVPNSLLNSSKVTNHSSPDPKRRIEVPIGVEYGADIEEVEEALDKVVSEEEEVLGEPGPKIFFDNFGDSALNFRVLCWVDEPMKDVKVRDRLNREIYRELNSRGIGIPFPQRDIHMQED